MSDGSGASPETRAAIARFWRRLIVMLIIQAIVIVAPVKLLPAFPS